MSFSTRDAKPKILSVEVQQWCTYGEPDDVKTLIISLLSGADLQSVLARLSDLEIDVLSEGPEVIVASVKCQLVIKISDLSGIAKIEMPGRYDPLVYSQSPEVP